MVGKARNFGLDLARAISILLVLIAHRFQHTYEWGIVGVQIFFILSGFLIGQILIRDFKNEGKVSTIIEFWKRRWYRTLPLYYLILIFKIFFYGNPFGWKMIVYFLFLQANFVGISFFGVSWSLVVEEWFYIFLPVATFIFFKHGLNLKKYALFLFGFIVFFFVARFAWNYFHKGVIIYQFDCLLLGVALALLKIEKNNIYIKLNSVYLFLIGVLGILFLTFILGDIDKRSIYDTFYKVVWYFLISIFVTFIIPFLELNIFVNKRLKSISVIYYFFTWTSILTYAIYLIHMEIFQIELNCLSSFVKLLAQIIFIYTISFFLYAVYEHPMLSLRDNLSFNQFIKSIKSFSLKLPK
jgi:peptidoglycan/LPS O-acetylase OafA/YrhL